MVGGRRLRAVALTILRRHGMLTLRDLHGLIHAYGYCVHGSHPAKNLADAMAYEVEQGRADRIERGRYAQRAGGAADPFRRGGTTRAQLCQPPEASATLVLPAEIQGIIERSSAPTFSMGCSRPRRGAR